MGFGHRVYRAEDPRARVLRATCERLGAPRFEVAAALEKAALDELHARRPDRVLATNVEFWAAVLLDFAEVPASMFTPMFTCARSAGWSAHVLEQKTTGRLIRPSSRYIGPGPPAGGVRRRLARLTRPPPAPPRGTSFSRMPRGRLKTSLSAYMDVRVVDLTSHRSDKSARH